MKKSKIILFILLLLLVPGISVQAKTVNENIGGQGNNQQYKEETRGSSYNSTPFGVRISIITYNKETGDVVKRGHAIDFWSSLPTSTYYFSGQKNRYEAISTSTNLKYGGYRGYINNNHVSTDIRFSGNFYHTTGKNTIVRDAVMNKIKQYESSDYDDFLKLFGTSLSEITQNCLRENVYVVVEPLVTIYEVAGGKTIAGTGTQVGKYIASQNLYWIKTIIGDGRISEAVYTPNSMAGVTGVSTGESFNTRFARNNNVTNGRIYGYSMGLFEIPGLNDGCVDRILANCNFGLDSSVPGNCNNGTTGYIKDKSDWACIYASAYSKNEQIKNQYLQYENRYCKIYCREDVTYNFPGKNLTVPAGSYFTLGGVNSSNTLSPIAITGISTCRAVGTESVSKETPINISRPSDVKSKNVHYFEEDMRNASTQAERDKYYKELLECYSFQKTYSEFDPTLMFNYNEGEYSSKGTSYTYSGALSGTSELYSKSTYMGNNSTFLGSKVWSTSSYKNANKLIFDKTSSANNYVTTKNNFGYTYPVAAKVEQVTTKKFNYQLKNGLYNYVNKPSGISTHTPYTDNYYTVGFSNLPISYAREARNDYTYKLGFTKNWFGKNQRFYNFLAQNYRVDIDYNISGKVDEGDLYNKIVNNNTALNAIADDRSGHNLLNKTFTTQLVKLGYSVDDFLQTSCTKVAGCITTNVTGETRVICKSDIKNPSCSSDNPSGCSNNYSGLKKCIQDTVADLSGSSFMKTDLNYKCTYSVSKGITDLLVDSDRGVGIDVIYRPISLDDPFPDREAGDNWSDLSIYNYITYNRGVLGNKLYTERGPLYTMTMTPEVAKKIRKYNTTHEYPDFTLECNKDGGKCLSEFLRNSEFSKYIKGCGIKGKTGGFKCAAGEAW